jgi:hypothetical protein
MPKISKGRLDGVYGMEQYTSDELYIMASQEEEKLKDPINSDDPKWIKRRVEKLRALALKKEKSLEHKENQ